jgi:hypothetical protein
VKNQPTFRRKIFSLSSDSTNTPSRKSALSMWHRGTLAQKIQFLVPASVKPSDPTVFTKTKPIETKWFPNETSITLSLRTENAPKCGQGTTVVGRCRTEFLLSSSRSRRRRNSALFQPLDTELLLTRPHFPQRQQSHRNCCWWEVGVVLEVGRVTAVCSVKRRFTSKEFHL